MKQDKYIASRLLEGIELYPGTSPEQSSLFYRTLRDAYKYEERICGHEEFYPEMSLDQKVAKALNFMAELPTYNKHVRSAFPADATNIVESARHSISYLYAIGDESIVETLLKLNKDQVSALKFVKEKYETGLKITKLIGLSSEAIKFFTRDDKLITKCIENEINPADFNGWEVDHIKGAIKLYFKGANLERLKRLELSERKEIVNQINKSQSEWYDQEQKIVELIRLSGLDQPPQEVVPSFSVTKFLGTAPVFSSVLHFKYVAPAVQVQQVDATTAIEPVFFQRSQSLAEFEELLRSNPVLQLTPLSVPEEVVPTTAVVPHYETPTPQHTTISMPIAANLGGALMRIAENSGTIQYWLSNMLPIGSLDCLDNPYLMTGLHVVGGAMVMNMPSTLPMHIKLAASGMSSAVYAGKKLLLEAQKEDLSIIKEQEIAGIKDFIDVCGYQMITGAGTSLLTSLPYNIIFGFNIPGMILNALQGAVASGAICYAVHNNDNKIGEDGLSSGILPAIASAGATYALYKNGMIPTTAGLIEDGFLTNVDKLFTSAAVVASSHFTTKLCQDSFLSGLTTPSDSEEV